MAHEFTTLTLEIERGVATATFYRPDKMNAFNRAALEDMLALFDRTDADDAVKVLIVTGSGRAFCAGADLAAAGAATFDYTKRQQAGEDVPRDGGGRLTLRIFDSRKPVICAVNGAAVGIGATMQLPMDIRIASTTARFGFVFTRRGVVPEACSSWFLPRIVGISTALEWCATGRVFSAEEALARGLVRSLHAPDELMPAANALAREIADNTAPVSVAITRQMLWRMLGAAHPMAAHGSTAAP